MFLGASVKTIFVFLRGLAKPPHEIKEMNQVLDFNFSIVTWHLPRAIYEKQMRYSRLLASIEGIGPTKGAAPKAAAPLVGGAAAGRPSISSI